MSRIGLLSDSHGGAEATRRGVSALMGHQAQVLIHLGDIGSVEVLDALAVTDTADSQVPAHLVFGNTDLDLHGLEAYAQGLGISVDHPAGRMPVHENNGRGELVFTHGHDSRLVAQALEEQVAYLCHGHTHTMIDQRHGNTRVINPGALSRAAQYSVALLDTDSDELTFIRIDKG